ncbi:hypothetical protein J1N35_034596 [Gossypium stocksii]|uniref:Uncharacterized protein n=1 Tax=Gossypium stocksii TaxID=47602 RepID=A0A9D3USM9_9ROSI|nr:hypothetical protein J1N35_034596 [Gossypium stocksii]
MNLSCCDAPSSNSSGFTYFILKGLRELPQTLLLAVAELDDLSDKVTISLQVNHDSPTLLYIFGPLGRLQNKHRWSDWPVICGVTG